MQDIDFIPGPLHPDLFGGETPIMVPCEGLPAVFGVEVCWPAGAEIECRKLTVLARSHGEAAHLALDVSRRTNSVCAEVVDVQRRRRRPMPHELEAWTKRMEVRS